MAGFGDGDIKLSTSARPPHSEDLDSPIGSDGDGRSTGGAIAMNAVLGGGIGVFIGVALGFFLPLNPVTTGFIGAALGSIIGAVLSGMFNWGASSISRQSGFAEVEVDTPEDRQDQVTDILNKYHPVSLRGRDHQPPPAQQEAGESRSGLLVELLGAKVKRPDTTSRSGDILAVREGIYYDPEDASQLDTDDTRLPGYDFYRRDFRHHFEHHYANGHSFGDYEPAYMYGYTLAVDHRHDDYDWYDIEPGVRDRWQEQHGDTWEEYQDAIRYAWDQIRNAFNDSRHS
jgi:hypothetical protein